VSSGADRAAVKPVVVYVDGIRTSNGAIDDTFDHDVGSMAKSNLVVVSGASFAWTSAVP